MTPPHASRGTTPRRALPVLALALATALAAVVACETFAPTGPDAGPAPTPRFDGGEVLARLAHGADIQAIHARYGTRTIEAIEGERIYLLALPEDRTVDDVLPAMQGDPEVQAASPNYEASIPEAQGGRSTMAFADPSLERADYTDQSAVRRIRAQEAWSRSRGGDVVVAILDTGIDPGHPDFDGRIASGAADLVDDDADPSDAPDGLDSDGDGLVDEAVGHGSFVAGLVLSVAPDARILPIRILDSDGIGTAVDVARGIELAVERGARVVNLSFGMAVESEVVAALIDDYSDRRHVVFVSSAGNAGGRIRQYPAASAEVLAVAAVDPADRKADFSNHGSWVPVAAPGVGLVAPLPGGYGRWSGTSFSAGLASGEAAVLVGFDPAAWSQDVRDAIEESATSTSDPTLEGAGRIDVVAALDRLAEGTGGLVVVAGRVEAVDPAGRTVDLAGGTRIEVPDDGAIEGGSDFATLADVAAALDAGVEIDAEAQVAVDGIVPRAVRIAFERVSGEEPAPPGGDDGTGNDGTGDDGTGGDDDGPGVDVDATVHLQGEVAGVDVVARTFVVAGTTVRLDTDDPVDPAGDLLTLEAVAAALALGQTVNAEVEGVQEGDVVVATSVRFETD